MEILQSQLSFYRNGSRSAGKLVPHYRRMECAYYKVQQKDTFALCVYSPSKN